MKKYYSGRNSAKFWTKINKTGSIRLYSKACDLQQLEIDVLKSLSKQEVKQ